MSNVRYLTPSRAPGIEVVHYEPAVVHEGVPVTTLISALNRGGLTVSNVPGRGLVIHRMGDNPARPAFRPTFEDPT